MTWCDIITKNDKILQLKFFYYKNIIILHKVCNTITYVINVGGSNTYVPKYIMNR